MAVFVLDVETTGLDPRRHRIIEVALIELDDAGRTVSEWATIVRPGGGEVDAEALRVNGIRWDQLEAAPSETYVARRLAQWLLPDATIIAHHAPFDLGFLHFLFARHGLPSWSGDFICTRTAFGVLVPGHKRSLHHVAAYFGVTIEGRHRALGDARATAEVYRRLADMAHARGIDLRNLLLRDPDRPLAWVPPRARWWTAA